MASILKKIFYDPLHPAGYGTVKNLHNAVKDQGISKRQIVKWLQKQKTYTLHKPVRKKFPRRQVEVRQIDQQFQADLADMSNISEYNRGIRYLLVVIDSFSRYCWVVPINNKRPKTIIAAFKKILKERQPDCIYTDNGTEFKNKDFKAFLKKEGIQFFTAHNSETKASIAERMIRTLKTRLYKYFTAKNTWRYLDILPRIVKGYNHRIHRSIQMAPVNVSYDNANKIRNLLTAKKYQIKFKFNMGDTVRASKTKHYFDKGYYPNYTEEIFTVHRRYKRNGIPLYILKDHGDEILKGAFYQEELQTVISPEIWEVEKVIKTRGRGKGKDFFVKWKGYPAKFNQWVHNLYKNE
jgi:transposase InsO family protein